jgi:acetyl-CoA C-acetyltransferase
MRDVFVIGIGQTPIGEWWDRSLRHLAYDALKAAIEDAAIERPDALYVGNMLAGQLSRQAHLGALIADFCGWRGIEAVTVEAACASGGAAFQAGLRAVASGAVETSAVVGVEKMTDGIGSAITGALATAADADYEIVHGVTFAALNALVMQRYIHEYDVCHDDFAPFSINAHRNAVDNPNAMFHKPISLETYRHGSLIAPPITLYDSSPICDGAAAAILCSADALRNLPKANPIKVLASATATDSLALHDRHDLLGAEAVEASARRAFASAGIGPWDVDVFELHDAFTIMAALSLEASGYAEPGRATFLARDGEIGLGGKIPVCTMGGLKARGHPVGATGAYEIVDAITQLRGDAGKNQIKNAHIAMAQNVGGTGATVVTHIFER